MAPTRRCSVRRTKCAVRRTLTLEHEMKFSIYISFLLAGLLTGCSTVGRGIGAGGTAFTGQEAASIAIAFHNNLESNGFHVTKTMTNDTICLSFSRSSTAGTANFKPNSTGNTSGYSYHYSATDDGWPWFAGHRLRMVSHSFDETIK